MPPIYRKLIGGLLLICVMIVATPVWAQSDRILLIGGNFRLQGNFNNTQAGSGFYGAPQYKDSNDGSLLFVDTRLRLYFDLRPSSYIRLNYKMEVGDITFGADEIITDGDGFRLPNVGGSAGGEPGSDGVNVQTKNAYLDVNVPWAPGFSFRGGIIGWGDQFDWTILATDFTGLQLTYQRQAWWTQFTFLKFFEGSLRTNDDDSNWYALDTRYGLTPQTSLTASVYFWDDNTNDNPDGDNAYQLYAGLKLNTVLFGKGLLTLYGVYNRGQEYQGQAMVTGFNGAERGGLTGANNQGFMANLNFDYPLKKHWLGVTFQYISGEKGSRTQLDEDSVGRDINAFLGLFNSQYSGFGLFRYTGGGGLELTTLGFLNDSTAGLNNVAVSPFFGGGYNGRMLAVLRSKLQATPVLFVYAAAGLDLAAEENANGDRWRGIEFTASLHWDIMPKLWLRTGFAYMLTGDWWDNNDDIALQGYPQPLGLDHTGKADNIYQFCIRLQYDFG